MKEGHRIKVDFASRLFFINKRASLELSFFHMFFTLFFFHITEGNNTFDPRSLTFFPALSIKLLARGRQSVT